MNLYEILEVSETASEETINKIYKIQAKRYHPDLQKTDQEKKIAEEKMKKINDAYDILSDSQKRKEYDEKLETERKKQEEKIYNDMIQKYKESNFSNQTDLSNEYEIKEENTINQQESVQQPQRRVYTKKDYIRDYNKRLRKFKFENWKNNLAINIKTFIIMAIIITIVWFFPPTHKLLISLYEENVVIQTIVEIFKRLVESFKNL